MEHQSIMIINTLDLWPHYERGRGIYPPALAHISFLIRPYLMRNVNVRAKDIWQDFELSMANKSNCSFRVWPQSPSKFILSGPLLLVPIYSHHLGRGLLDHFLCCTNGNSGLCKFDTIKNNSSKIKLLKELIA